MSSQKGNVKKSGGQKHQNRTAFKNSLHDTNKRSQAIRETTVSGVCERCKDIVDWKIKYKKYKPLSQPKKCVKCLQKTVKKAYYIVCDSCAQNNGICAKCAHPANVVVPHEVTAAEEAKQQSERIFELKQLSERKRRAFIRQEESGKFKEQNELQGKEECLAELNASDSSDFESDCDSGESNEELSDMVVKSTSVDTTDINSKVDTSLKLCSSEKVEHHVVIESDPS